MRRVALVASFGAVTAACAAVIGVGGVDYGAAPDAGHDTGATDAGADAADATDALTTDDGGCPFGAYACAVLASGPMLYLRFDEPARSSTAKDLSGLGHDGAYPSTGVHLGAPGAIASDPASTAVRLDGTAGQAITMPSFADFAGDIGATFSVELWANPDVASPATPFAFLVDHEGFTPRGGWMVGLAGSEVQSELWTDDSRFGRVFSTTQPAVAGTWHHVVVVYQGMSATMWVDGLRLFDLPVNTDGQLLPQIAAAGADGGVWSIGKQNCTPCDANDFVGNIDELAIYPRALTDTEVGDYLMKSR